MGGTEQPVWTGGYKLPVYPFVPPPELARGERKRYPIVIVGGGLSGLTLGCDLANRGIDSLIGKNVRIYRVPVKPSAYRFMLGDNSEIGIRW